MVLTCCTISSTLILHLHPTILQNIEPQTTAVSLLQLVNGEYHAVTSNTVLCVSQITTHCQVSSHQVITSCIHWFSLLQRVSIACYAERCISYDRFRPSVRLSVRPSQSGIMSKRLKLRSCGLYCRIAPWLYTDRSNNGEQIGSRIGLHAFDFYQNHPPWMTLNGQNALCCTKDTSFGAHCTNLNEDRPILSANKNVGQWL